MSYPKRVENCGITQKFRRKSKTMIDERIRSGYINDFSTVDLESLMLS
jgi:hypothetical protein